MAIIPSIVSASGAIADFLTNAVTMDSGSAEVNINGDGKLSLSWKSLSGGVINIGDTVTIEGIGKFIANDIYTPTFSNGVYTWSPTLVSTDSLLAKTLFWKEVTMSDGETTRLFTFSYTGTAGTLVAELSSAASGVGSVSLNPSYADTGITVSFDGDSIKSAAQKIASALGVNITIINGCIEIGVHEAYTADEYFNYFIVLGGTRNMGKKTLQNSQYYSAVTQRLTMDNNGSVIDKSGSEPKMMKLLVNDDIYPKMELTIGSVDTRECWLLDENGEKIPTEWYEVDGKQYPVEATCKKYLKYYITLKLGTEDYSLNHEILIAGKPLGILFQDGLLAGREFDLVHFTEGVVEKEADDVSDSGYTVAAGSYRIIMQADGETLLPNSILTPVVGDKVTLTGVALDSAYITAAKARLAEWGNQMANLYSSKKAPQFEAEESVDDFLLGDSYSASTANLGSTGSTSDYICTSITTDLITGHKKVTFGTFKAKGLLQTLIDKVDSVSLSGAGGTVADDYTRNTAPMGIDQFKALQQAGGSLGMMSMNRKVAANAESIEELAEIVDDVKEQSDKKFDIWYGQGVPWPQEDDGNDQTDRYIYPAVDWDTVEKKELHLQDLYYDMTREAQEMGGNNWRWSKKVEDGATIYYWELITDGDTLAAYEKINDVASDGKLSGGAEKMKVLIDWTNAAEDYAINYQKYLESGIEEWTAYDVAFRLLCKFLNNGAELFEGESSEDDAEELVISIPLPSLIDNAHVQLTSSISFTVTDSDGNEKNYYDVWADYYTARANFSTALIARANQTAANALSEMAKMSNDNLLTVAEKPNILREWQAAYSDYATLTSQASRAHILSLAAYTNFQLAYRKLGTYLEDPENYDETDLMPTPSDVPNIFNTESGQPGTEDTAINGTTFNTLWKTFYEKRSILMTALGVSHTSNFVSVDVPSAPYYQGDLWVKIEADDNSIKTLMICIQECTDTSTPATTRINHWKEYDVNVDDPRVLLANLADIIYAKIPSVKEVLHSRSLTIYFSSSETGYDGDLRYDGANVEVNSGGTWQSVGDDVMANTFGAVAAIVGRSSIVVYADASDRTGATKYDLYIRDLEFRVTVGGNTIGDYTGNIEVMMYNGERWELINKSINSVLENLGNIIKAFVFGSEDKDFVTAAGTVITSKAAEMFAQAKVRDTKVNNEWQLPGEHDDNGYVLVTEALFGLRIVSHTETGADGKEVTIYESTGKLSADRLDFEGKEINLGAAKNINLKAEQIQAIGDMTLEGAFSTYDDNSLAYASMAGGKLEIGTYQNQGNGGKLTTARYRVALVNKGGVMCPVIQFLDRTGENPLLQLDDSLLDRLNSAACTVDTSTNQTTTTSKNEVPDSYAQQPMRYIGGDIAAATFDSVVNTPASMYYRFNEGFTQTITIVKDAQGNEVSKTIATEYNYGNDGDKTTPDPTKQGRLYPNTTLGDYITDGWYSPASAIFSTKNGNGTTTLRVVLIPVTDGKEDSSNTQVISKIVNNSNS